MNSCFPTTGCVHVHRWAAEPPWERKRLMAATLRAGRSGEKVHLAPHPDRATWPCRPVPPRRGLRPQRRQQAGRACWRVRCGRDVMALMRVDGPSLTARGVAAARLELERAAAPTGDPGAEERLARSLAQEAEEMAGGVTDGGAAQRPGRPERRQRRQPGGDFFAFLAARTRFFDDAVLRAIDGGVRQIVILGAGYDGRPLRFRTPGVRFFEVDHPATQGDKRRRLSEIGAATDDIAFVPADFTEPGLATVLTAGGYDRQQRSLVTCEGVLRYLPEPWFRELLSVTSEMATPGSELAVSISTR